MSRYAPLDLDLLRTLRAQGKSYDRIARIVHSNYNRVRRYLDPDYDLHLCEYDRAKQARRRGQRDGYGCQGDRFTTRRWFAENDARASAALEAAGIRYK